MRRYLFKEKKSFSKENFILFVICLGFTAIGMVLIRNEIYADEWYMEGSADGLFGADNRSLFTICANFIITGIIYLLSLTGIRLFWMYWLFAVIQGISSFLICKLIMERVGQEIGYVICFTFLALITPLIYFYMHFTVTASYIIAAGCLWLFYSLEHHKSLGHYIFSVMWIVLGTSIRSNCFAFAIVFMGMLWILKISKFFYDHKKEISICFIKETVFRYLRPFLLTLIVLAIIQGSQAIMMEYVNPGYEEWNTERAHVDDYIIPDYDEHIEDYQNIGMSYNDYLLLRSWNNQDPDFFTEELYEKILKIKDTYQNAGVTNLGIFAYMGASIKAMSGTIFLWIGLFLTLYAFFGVGIWYGLACFSVILCDWALTTYFSYIGRLVLRTECSIWIFVLISLVSVFLTPSSKCTEINFSKFGPIKNVFVLVMCVTTICARPNNVKLSNELTNNTWNPFYATSIFDNYKERYQNGNSYGRYLYANLLNREAPSSDTMDPAFNSYLENNKEKLFLVSNSETWMMLLPLVCKDVWHTVPVGGGENFFPLGQYMVRLKPMQKILEQRGITNHFKALVNDDVRFAVRNFVPEPYYRSREINQYLKEHYYSDVNFSVEAIANYVVIGRFMRNYDTSDMIEKTGGIALQYSYYSQLEGMSQITLSNFQIDNFILSRDPAYVEITSPEGETYTCTTMDNGDGSLTVMLYNDIIQEGKAYSVRFIYEHYGQYFYFDAGTL